MISNHTSTLADLAHRFAQPLREFSPAPIWWWSGERLEPERLRWQLEQFVAGGVFNLVILNLAPTGPLYGSDADDPPFFSEAWWEIFLDVCAGARELGVRLWFYDQIGFSGANLQGGLVRDNPAFSGQWLASITVEGEGALALDCPPAGMPLTATLTRLDSGMTTPLSLDGRHVGDESSGRRRLRLIYAVRRGFDYFNADACATLLDTVHGAFERRAGDFFGDVIVGSFQDELPSLPTWSADFFAAFQAHTGYDLRPQIGLLWEGDGADAQRVRAGYHAVRAALAEQAFFKPLFTWHERHGLICGFDQQGPARAGDPVETVTLYADYLKTHRWFGAPGSDHHGEAKIHSSLAHLYNRPRTWIEAFHSSGWGGTLEETFDWLLPWLRAGANLYDPHAVYYSTRGGWWEWAPPSTCWRQPYWRHYALFAGAVSRLCHVLSQGDHVCDIGVLFPTATVQAHTTPDGPLPLARAAHDAYLALVGRMIWFDTHAGVLDRDRRDFDVLDDDSLQRADVGDGVLSIGAERYRAIVLPGCATLEAATAAVLCRFVESGGVLVAVGALPETPAGADAESVRRLPQLFAEGRATRVEQAGDLPAALEPLSRRVDAPVPTLHRRIGNHDVLFVPATFPRATEVQFKGIWWNIDYAFNPGQYPRRMTVRLLGTQGVPQLWNPLNGERRRLEARTVGAYVEVDVPFDDSPAALLVWGDLEEDLPVVTLYQPGAIATTLEDWEARLEPTIDNRFGDFDRPAYAGAPPVQTWRFEHRVEHPAAEDAAWQPVEATFGTYGWWIGPLPVGELPPPGQEPADVLHTSGWQPARYSLTRGIAHDAIHNATLGPKGHVPYEFLAFGEARPGEGVRFRTTVWLPEAMALHLALGADAAKRAWINGVSLGEGPAGYLWLAPATLQAGSNLLEWELAVEHPANLRAAWALVRDRARFLRPEWLTAGDASIRDSSVRFMADFEIPFKPVEGVIQVGTAFPCRVLINGVEVGRQGGFDPYGLMMRVQRYAGDAFHQGTNRVVLELHDPGQPVALVADVGVRGAQGEEALLISGPGWQVQRDHGPLAQVALRRRQGGGGPAGEIVLSRDPPASDLWRRPHPLPGAVWLEDTPGDGTVLPVVPDAFARQPRVEWFRWTLPPGATAMHLPLHGAAQVWVDGTELPVDDGRVAIPASTDRQRVALVRVVPEYGRSEGGVFDGPVSYTVGQGPIDLGAWAERGLAAYSGGLRYRAGFSLDAGAAGQLTLDLGRVRGTAEVWVNGQAVGTRIWSPYRFDITAAAQAGLNTVEVLICNTLAPYLRAVSPTNYIFPGQEISGLFGPVTIQRS